MDDYPRVKRQHIDDKPSASYHTPPSASQRSGRSSGSSDGTRARAQRNLFGRDSPEEADEDIDAEQGATQAEEMFALSQESQPADSNISSRVEHEWHLVNAETGQPAAVPILRLSLSKRCKNLKKLWRREHLAHDLR